MRRILLLNVIYLRSWFSIDGDFNLSTKTSALNNHSEKYRWRWEEGKMGEYSAIICRYRRTLYRPHNSHSLDRWRDLEDVIILNYSGMIDAWSTLLVTASVRWSTDETCNLPHIRRGGQKKINCFKWGIDHLSLTLLNDTTYWHDMYRLLKMDWFGIRRHSCFLERLRQCWLRILMRTEEEDVK